ncbi:MAG: hypothetical protein ACMUIS_07075 [bacterium]
MEPEKIMDSLFKELTAELKAMSKAQTIDEKMKYSQIIHNLCESLGVFLNLASDMMGLDLEE